jgi:hypothetical protein
MQETKWGRYFAHIFNRLYTSFGSWLYYHLQVIVIILRDILIGVNSVTIDSWNDFYTSEIEVVVCTGFEIS